MTIKLNEEAYDILKDSFHASSILSNILLFNNIFREYDIRGQYGYNLNEIITYFIGKAFVRMTSQDIAMQYLGIEKHENPLYVIGMDGRISSPSLKKALSKGIIDAGGKIVDIGICPTPQVYYADILYNASGSIMITGSHNPKEDNGFKMVGAHKAFYGAQIAFLKDIVMKDLMAIKTSESMLNTIIQRLNTDLSFDNDMVENLNCNQSYITRILSEVKINPNLNIVWDAGNGSAGPIIAELINQMDCSSEKMFCEVDGNFPNHHADPTVIENLIDLRSKVLDTQADIGIAFDGDGDRLGVIDNNGDFIDGDTLVAIFAKELVKTYEEPVVIVDIKSSEFIFQYLKQLGCNPILWKTGHSLIKNKMIETEAILAGEMSGHIFFKDRYYGFDDAIYASLRLLEIMSLTNKTLAELKALIPSYPSSKEIRIDIRGQDPITIIAAVKRQLEKENKNFISIDGIRVSDDYGWWIIRASNTQNVIITRFQGIDDNALLKKRTEVEKILKPFGLSF
jgi:phosphomannomutase